MTLPEYLSPELSECSECGHDHWDEQEAPWCAFPARQLTGAPFTYHAYIGRGDRPTETCRHDHRRPWTAEDCARRLARRRNIEEQQARRYERCPLAPEGCTCPYAEGEDR